MELILNLGWLLLAVACYHFWWPRRRRSGAGTTRGFRGLLALGCALVVLFPIISVTDDLHAEQAVMEDSSARLGKMWGNTHSAASAGQHFSTLRTILPSHFPDPRRVVGRVLVTDPSSPCVGVNSPRFGRAPPLSLS
ncbi:MAG: hypothetical protein ACLQOO_04075 [Terriglobia bacterium]